jgi:hypothetical protein
LSCQLTFRKQKCGGVTETATCVACQTRNVTCSFEMEARDPRFNPYLRIQKLASPRWEESDMRAMIATASSTFSPPQPPMSVQQPKRTGSFQYVTISPHYWVMTDEKGRYRGIRVRFSRPTYIQASPTSAQASFAITRFSIPSRAYEIRRLRFPAEGAAPPVKVIWTTAYLSRHQSPSRVHGVTTIRSYLTDL